jgi:hypothetical protein
VTRDTSRRGFNGLVVTLVIFSKVFYRRSAISRRLKVRRKGPRGGIYQTERQVASTGKLVAWSAGVSVCVWFGWVSCVGLSGTHTSMQA